MQIMKLTSIISLFSIAFLLIACNNNEPKATEPAAETVSPPIVGADADDIPLAGLAPLLDAAPGFVAISDARMAEGVIGLNEPGTVADDAEHGLRKRDAAADVRAAFGGTFQRAEEEQVTVHPAGMSEGMAGADLLLEIHGKAGRNVHGERAGGLHPLAFGHQV